MGILNVTPDSFSDGGRLGSTEAAVEYASTLLAEGADIIDVGGESTRPQGARKVGAEEERERVLPVLAAIRRRHPDAIVSVDTTKRAVAEGAVAEGAEIVNDVSGLRLDPEMAAFCAGAAVGVVLMHSRGEVHDMATYAHACYAGDPVEEVARELEERVTAAAAAGIARDRIAVDPGVGFAKRSEHSLRVLARLDRVVRLGFPVVVGASRKRVVGELTGVARPAERVFGSVGAAVAALDRGALIFRVHDVAATRQALDVAAAIRRAGAA